ncbi:MAG: helix-turn-helix domain-containing GNAT family N-acetyltransferase [Acidimicrobiales bacterium]
MASDVDVVRAFNRTVTEMAGALDEHHLARGRPLGASRLLWEIGLEGDLAEVRALRSRLGLDAGYVSRLLRSLEAEGLVEVVADAADQRARVARLTAAGRRERRELDRLSDDLAGSWLDALDEGRRARMVDAMAEVTRCLRSIAVEIAPEPADSPDAAVCLRRYMAELDERFDIGFDPAAALPLEPEAITPPDGVLLLARLHGDPVGCAAVKFLPGPLAEIKRMWVAPSARGLGVARRLLADLEERARAAGCRRSQLDTNGTLAEAIALYRSAGYQEVDAFNDEPHATLWFARDL